MHNNIWLVADLTSKDKNMDKMGPHLEFWSSMQPTIYTFSEVVF